MNVEVLSWTDILGFGLELRNVKSFTRSKTLELNFTPRKARKSRQIYNFNLNQIEVDGYYWGKRLNIRAR